VSVTGELVVTGYKIYAFCQNSGFRSVGTAEEGCRRKRDYCRRRRRHRRRQLLGREKAAPRTIGPLFVNILLYYYLYNVIIIIIIIIIIKYIL